MLGWLAHASGGGSVASAAATAVVASPSTLLENQVANQWLDIIIQLTNATWNDPLTTANKTAIIQGLDSSGTESKGWNAEVRDKLLPLAVTRLSDTVVKISLVGSTAYQIAANETVTFTAPASAQSDDALVATPTIQITASSDAGITNTTADDSVTDNALIDDRTGFREYVADGLVNDGHMPGMMTRKKSMDPRHPQESIGSRSDAQNGSVSPEGNDTFLTSAEVSASDL